MAKIKNSTEPIHPHGGIFIIHELFQSGGIPSLIDEHLGIRSKLYGYQYSQIIESMLLTQFSGGSCIEDVNELREVFSSHPNFKVCSPDTVLRIFDELKTTTLSIESNSGVKHEFNIHPKLNELLLKTIKHTTSLDLSKSHTLDYDNTINACEKYDAKRTYKHVDGYQPGVACIGNMPVYIEGRNGNSNAKFNMKETLERCFDQLKQASIRIDKFRSDSAAYQKDVIELNEKRDHTFYIRAVSSGDLKLKIKTITEWSSFEYNHQNIEIAEMNYAPFGGAKEYRFVVQRKKSGGKQIDVFSGDNYDYHSIITDDLLSTPQEIYCFYNQRGSSENLFEILKHDFNWKYLPCSFLDQNTVFMIISALCYVLYEWIKKHIAKHFDWLPANARIKKFVFRFINVAAKWIYTSRQHVLKIFSSRNYADIPLKI